MRPGQRVYWHGVFPDFDRRGTVVGDPGTLRTGVRWDGSGDVSLVSNDSIKGVTEHKRCPCGRCGGRS